MNYTSTQVIEKCENEILNPVTFYQSDVVNYRGKTSDTKTYYTEIVADFLIKNIELFRCGIPKITRTASYKTVSHDGVYSELSTRIEEVTAMKMFNYSKKGNIYDFIGRIIDYQTPLKSKRSDEAGKIDLLAYDGKTLRLLELKKIDSVETMLRCVLEGYTYFKTVDAAKLLCDFGLPLSTKVTACPFVFTQGVQWEEMQENRPKLKELMAALESKPYYISCRESDFYIVKDE